MKKKLLIIGAGGHGRCCLDIARERGIYDEICFLDDKNIGTVVNGSKVVDSISNLERYANEYKVFVAIGNNELRRKIAKKAEEFGAEMVSLISRKSMVSEYAIVRNGSVVFPGVVIEANVRIGEGCIITSNATINHDVVMEEYSLVYSNTVIRPNVVIGEKTRIGSRCVVTFGKNIEAGVDIPDGEII